MCNHIRPVSFNATLFNTGVEDIPYLINLHYRIVNPISISYEICLTCTFRGVEVIQFFFKFTQLSPVHEAPLVANANNQLLSEFRCAMITGIT
jgi:hypothetical protein